MPKVIQLGQGMERVWEDNGGRNFKIRLSKFHGQCYVAVIWYETDKTNFVKNMLSYCHYKKYWIVAKNGLIFAEECCCMLYFSFLYERLEPVHATVSNHLNNNRRLSMQYFSILSWSKFSYIEFLHWPVCPLLRIHFLNN